MALRHPRSFFHRRLTWLGLGALGLVVLAWLMTDREARATSGEPKSAPAVVVRVAEVVQNDVSIDVQAVGMVQASAQAVVLSPRSMRCTHSVQLSTQPLPRGTSGVCSVSGSCTKLRAL